MHVYYSKASKLIHWEYKGTLRIENPFLAMLMKICAVFVILSSVDAGSKKCWEFPWVKIYEHYMDRNLEMQLKSRIKNLTNSSSLRWSCMLSIKAGGLAQQFIVNTTESSPPPVNPGWLLYAWGKNEYGGKLVTLREGSVFIETARSNSSVGCGRAKLRKWFVILCQARNSTRAALLKKT
ncbi:unnamed protein product [Cylicocyclus nassatus]|uniref:Uncharacterized protein n=1 Tax=Cylicocyclus nassatus TaxID=53992 RepID=A0AA36DNM6_CYLNA|nr:unnamed protein product [Cylicocyclus nassatus]